MRGSSGVTGHIHSEGPGERADLLGGQPQLLAVDARVLGKLLLTASDAARALAVSDRKLWSLKASGEIPCVRVGRAVRYDPRDLVAWIDRRKEKA